MKKTFLRGSVAALACSIVLSSGMASAAAAPSPDKPTESPVTQNVDRFVPLSPKEVKMTNEGLTSLGRAPLPEGTTGLIFQEDGSVDAVNAAGDVIQRPNDVVPANRPTTAGVIPQEIKEVVAACLGVSATSSSLWMAVVEKLATWQGAVKFVVRRVGVVGAVTCMGGIVWHYL